MVDHVNEWHRSGTQQTCAIPMPQFYYSNWNFLFTSQLVRIVVHCVEVEFVWY